MILQRLGAVLLVCLPVACTTGMSSNPASSIPDRIVTERGGFIPEGIEYDTRNRRFLTGSLSDGSIYEISNRGRLRIVVTDEALMSSVGIEVDEVRNRLLVANADRSTGGGAALLGIYDLATGDRLAMVDLSGSIENPPADAGYFANDVAISTAGTAFVTDTRMNIIYKVDRYFKASVLLDLGQNSGFNLNGIEYHPEGYLIVVSSGSGQLLKVSVNNPQRWSLVALDFPAAGGDGLVWAADGGLVSTSNNTSSVMKYASDDHWASARLTGMASFAGQATTAAAVGNDIFVVQPHFADDDPPVILRARF